ncbi:MAG: hypothetical protein K8R53_10745, partial [Bacteroidales bacterium]|nr:hypothetical protein [Bacteroidales bacterium]
MINRKNYKNYFSDYWDNNLTPKQEETVHVFLEQNPDLSNEFEACSEVILNPDLQEQFSDKAYLKKTEITPVGYITEKNYAEIFIRFYENDLSPKELAEINVFLSENPFLKHEFSSFKHTFIKPDKSISYRDKNKLKKPVPIYSVVTSFRSWSIAASIIILIGILFLLKNQGKQENIRPKGVFISQIDPINTNNSLLNERHIPFRDNFSSMIKNPPPATVEERTISTERQEHKELALIQSQDTKTIAISAQ